MIKNNHEPIIDEATFQLVQQMLQRDTRTSPKDDVVQPLSGVVFCGDCGRSMCRRAIKKGENVFRYYICSSNKRNGECSSHSFSQQSLEEIISRAIQKQIDVVVELDKLLEEIENTGILAAKLKRLNVMMGETETEIENYQEFRRKLLEAFHEKLIDRTEYDAMRRKYTEMISSAQMNLEKIARERAAAIDGETEARAWVTQFIRYQGERKLTREMVVTLIDKIYVYEGKRIKIEFNYRNEIACYQDLLLQMKKEVG